MKRWIAIPIYMSLALLDLLIKVLMERLEYVIFPDKPKEDEPS